MRTRSAHGNVRKSTQLELGANADQEARKKSALQCTGTDMGTRRCLPRGLTNTIGTGLASMASQAMNVTSQFAMHFDAESDR